MNRERESRALERDYFSLFDLPRQYTLDLNRLSDTYRAILAQVHPDRVALGDGTARRRAVEEAAYVNDAYRTLKDPVLRGGYLLQCHGEAPLGPNEALPPEFLSEQLNAREAAEEAWQAGDMARLESLRQSLHATQQEEQAALARLLDKEMPDAVMRQRARLHLLSLQFLARFVEDLEEKIEV